MRTVISMAAPMLVRNALIYDSLRERTLRTQKFGQNKNYKPEIRRSKQSQMIKRKFPNKH
jgi:hypothetical protein